MGDAAGGGYGSGGKKLDLDLQAIAFDTSGKLMDAVYYNNMKALKKALTHSGDETGGEKGGYDEVIWANLRLLPDSCGSSPLTMAEIEQKNIRAGLDLMDLTPPVCAKNQLLQAKKIVSLHNVVPNQRRIKTFPKCDECRAPFHLNQIVFCCHVCTPHCCFVC